MKFIPPKAFLKKVQRVPHAPGTREGLELMDRNERTLDFPPEVMSELRQRITPFLLRAYPEPEPLYRKLAQWLKVPRERLLLTLAADGGLHSVFETFVQPGDEVVCITPSYAMVPVYCGISDAVCQEVSFGGDLSLPLERILERIHDRTKLVLLANPNQPIERVYTDQEMQILLAECLRYNALLVMDEAYHHFCPMTAAPWVAEYGNLIVVRSFSKAFGIAGVRLGYLLSQPENIQNLNKVRPMYETHSLAIAIGLYLLEHPDLMESYVRQVQQSVAAVTSTLRRLGIQAFGQWTNCVIVGLPEDLPAPKLQEALRGQGFLIRAETAAPLTNHLRITVGPLEQTLRFLKAFESILSDAKSHSVTH